MSEPNATLRNRLQQITCGDETQASAHPKLLAELASELPHSIVAASHLGPGLPIDRYNCFEFALGLAGCNEVRLISSYLPSTYCNGVFVKHLASSILIPTASVGSDGDLVLYRDSQQFTHAGLVHGGRVLSKWGTGQLWLHAPLEVPASYGHDFSCYGATSPNDVLANFLEFARQREGRTLVNEVLALGLRANVAV